MAGPEKKVEAAPRGPRPKLEKPRVRPAPVTPERAREGIARVRDDADAAMRESDVMNRAYTEGFHPDEGWAAIQERTTSRSESRARGFVFDRRSIARTLYRVRIGKNEGIKRKDIQKQVIDGSRHDLQIRRLQDYTALTGKTVRLMDPETEKQLRVLDEVLPEDFERQPQSHRLKIIRKITPQLDIQVSPERADVILLDLENGEDEHSAAVAVVNDDKGFTVILEQSDTTEDPEKVFLEAIKQSSPEVQARYREYLETWQAESVSAIFTPSEINGVPVESLSEAALQNAKQIIKTGTGIILNMEEGNYGTIEFGDFFGRCELHSVKGEPKLFIDDPNADTGRRGPINLNTAEVRAELAHALIDKFFSEQFRHFVGRGTQVDPQEIADAKLFKIVHAFLPPGSDEHMDRLDATQQSIIINLAILFATPDKKYISLQDKARFLNDLQPDRLAIAKRKLHEQCFPEKFSLSEFALKMNLHI